MAVINLSLLLSLVFIHSVLAVEYPFEAGKLIKRAHKVTGKVTILDGKRIRISDMTYDGLGTAKTNFVVGDVLPIKMRNGVFIPLNDTCISNGTDYNCGQDIPRMGMKGVPKGDVIVTLPGNVLFPDIKWLSLYCRNFRISFGDIMLNKTPEPLCKNKWPFNKCNKMRKHCKRRKQVRDNCNCACKVCCCNTMKDQTCERQKATCYKKRTKQFCRKSCNICTITGK